MKKFNIKKIDLCEGGLEYYQSKPSFEAAWNNCHRGDWMLWMAEKLGVDDCTLIRAKAMCANTVRHLMTDKRSTAAIDAALKYAGGKISRKELNAYAAYTAYTSAAADEIAYTYLIVMD